MREMDGWNSPREDLERLGSVLDEVDTMPPSSMRILLQSLALDRRAGSNGRRLDHLTDSPPRSRVLQSSG
jgi:hypothetical protein